MIIKAGSTNVSLPAYIVDSADGSPETGITIANLDLQYTRLGETPTTKVDATALAATDTAHTDNRAIALDDTDQPGVLRVDWPDAAFASGASCVVLSVTGSGYAPCHTAVWLAGVDVTSVNGTTANALGSTQIDFTAAASTSTTSVKMTTGSLSTTADEFADRFLIHVDSGEMRTVSASSDSAGVTSLTVAAFTAAAEGDAFILVGSSVSSR